jgi:hypothetical protein
MKAIGDYGSPLPKNQQNELFQLIPVFEASKKLSTKKAQPSVKKLKGKRTS